MTKITEQQYQMYCRKATWFLSRKRVPCWNDWFLIPLSFLLPSSLFPLSFLLPSSPLPHPFLPPSSLLAPSPFLPPSSFLAPSPFLPPSRPPLLLPNSSLSEGEVPLSPGDVRWYTVYSTKLAGKGGPHGGQTKRSESYYTPADHHCVVHSTTIANDYAMMNAAILMATFTFMTHMILAQAKLLHFSTVSVKVSSCAFHSSSCTGLMIMSWLQCCNYSLIPRPHPACMRAWE